MTLRGNLFFKIFLGFWLVSIAILGSWLLAAHYFDSIAFSDANTRHSGPPPRFMMATMYELQNTEASALPAFLAQTLREHDVQVLLLDAKGNDIFDRQVSDSVKEVAGQLEQRKGRRSRAFLKTREADLAAHTIYRRDRGQLRAVMVFKPQASKFLNILIQNLWLRIFLAVLISGIVCFALSRLMTNRLKELQQASRQLANGDLNTRIKVRQRGGDETDELARDFNTMAEQLQERLQAQKRLLGDVSHELRSPLARLRVALSLAEKNPAKSPEYLQRIEQESERLEDLIAQLLSAQSSGTALERHIDLVGLLEELCRDANFEGGASGRQVELTTAVEQAILSTRGDLLQRTFENLLRNALTHTPQQTKVRVQLQAMGKGYSVVVTDSGSGIPAAELEKIFQEFYRVDDARSRDTGGYGLGLAIARRAVEEHGGSISAENTDGGFAVSVFLPDLANPSTH